MVNREDDLCPGVRKCESARHFVCNSCLAEFESEEDRPECEVCGSSDIQAQRCDGCPLTYLDDIMSGWAGRLVGRAMDLLSACKMGVGVRLSDLTTQEFNAMQIIEQERNKRMMERRQQEEDRREMDEATRG